MRDAFLVATTGWLGACILEGDSSAGSGDCRVIDVSVIGVGLELFGAVTEDSSGVGPSSKSACPSDHL